MKIQIYAARYVARTLAYISIEMFLISAQKRFVLKFRSANKNTSPSKLGNWTLNDVFTGQLSKEHCEETRVAARSANNKRMRQAKIGREKRVSRAQNVFHYIIVIIDEEIFFFFL